MAVSRNSTGSARCAYSEQITQTFIVAATGLSIYINLYIAESQPLAMPDSVDQKRHVLPIEIRIQKRRDVVRGTKKEPDYVNTRLTYGYLQRKDGTAPSPPSTPRVDASDSKRTFERNMFLWRESLRQYVLCYSEPDTEPSTEGPFQ